MPGHRPGLQLKENTSQILIYMLSTRILEVVA